MRELRARFDALRPRKRDVLLHVVQGRLYKVLRTLCAAEDPDRKLSITLMAHSRNPKLKIAVTGANSPRGALLHRAGASQVVITDELIADALVDRLSKGDKA